MMKFQSGKSDINKEDSLKYLSNIGKGFTLIELIILIAILAIILSLAVPKVSGFIVTSKIAADQATVATLNRVTNFSRMTNLEEDPFLDETKKSEELLQKLVDDGYLSSLAKPQSKGAKFQWLIERERWHLSFEDSFYVISLSDGLTLSVSGGKKEWLEGSYTGESKDIIIPASIDGTIITHIYQEVFKGKGLISVIFGQESEIVQIHARAFQNNKLTNVDFPYTLKRIDTGSFENNILTEIKLPAGLVLIESHAFKNNKLTEVVFPETLKNINGHAFEKNDLRKITIGNAVTIGENIFGENTKNFNEAYGSGKAGTYKLIDGNWVKQSE